MFNLPRTTHRYLIEPVSNRPHINISIWKRFLKFTRLLSESRKTVLKNMFSIIKNDCRSTTGNNLRQIMLKTGHDVYIKADRGFDIKVLYETPEAEQWRIPLMIKLLNVKNNIVKIENFKSLDRCSRRYAVAN